MYLLWEVRKNMKICLGCGRFPKEGYTNIDIVPMCDGVVQMDLSKFPWSFEDDSVDEIQTDAFVEHLPQHDKMRLIEEMWRICKHGAMIVITTCSWDHPNQWQDPSHFSSWHIDNFNYFVEGSEYSYYSKARFKIIKKELRKPPEGNALYWELKVEKEKK